MKSRKSKKQRRVRKLEAKLALALMNAFISICGPIKKVRRNK